MKIILSPAKEMNLKNPIEKDWNISEKTRQVINTLLSLDQDELIKKLKVNEKIFKENLGYYKAFDKKTSFLALEMYNGLAFRWLDFTSLEKDQKDYLHENLYVLSALYGPISGMDLVKPYRLDFTMSLKVNGQSLKNFWKEEYNRTLEGHDPIINLASNEFSDLLDKDKFEILNFEFYELKDGNLKKHSTISKKARGLVARYMAQNKIKDIEQIKNFNLDGYKFSQKDSQKLNYVFIKEL